MENQPHSLPTISTPQSELTVIQIIAKYLAENGLPAVIAGPAGVAISRLIGGAADIPAAWLEQKAQRIRSRTLAEGTIANEIAKAASQRAVCDNDLLDRAVNQWTGSELRKQENREAVALAAIEQLSKESKSSDTKIDNNDATQGPTDDWLNQFEGHAGRASSAEMRQLFGRILAGEIRRRHSFSLRTMQFMATLDTEIAEIIDTISKYTIFGSRIPFSQDIKNEIGFDKLLISESVGLLTGITGLLHVNLFEKIDIDGETAFIARYEKCAYCAHLNAAVEKSKEYLQFPAIILTQTGSEVSSLARKDENDSEKLLVQAFRSDGDVVGVSKWDLVSANGQFQLFNRRDI